MSRRLSQESAPWTPEEDAILMGCWTNPDIGYARIAKLMPVPRTAEAVQLRAIELGLGEKARPKRRRRSAKKLSAWPDDMPNFEDHPLAAEPGSPARAARRGSRLRLKSHSANASLTGSSLEGASPQGLLIDE